MFRASTTSRDGLTAISSGATQPIWGCRSSQICSSHARWSRRCADTNLQTSTSLPGTILPVRRTKVVGISSAPTIFGHFAAGAKVSLDALQACPISSPTMNEMMDHPAAREARPPVVDGGQWREPFAFLEALDSLCCPVDMRPLRWVESEGVLLSSDGARRYPVVDGIPCLFAPN